MPHDSRWRTSVADVGISVEVIAVGTEMLLGQIVNTNASWIGSRLAESGLEHYHQVVVGDNHDRIVAAILHATNRADVVIVSGGLGPTQDDVTRLAMAAVAEVDLVRDERYAAQLRTLWEGRGRRMPESNLKQADYPDGATTFSNPEGTAPGLRLMVGDCPVYAVPGVPEELYPMVDNFVLPDIERLAGGLVGVVVSRLIRTWGESESQIAELLDDLFVGSTNPTLAFLASSGEITIRVTAKADSAAAAEALILPVEAEARSRLGSLVFGTDDGTVEKAVVAELVALGWTVGTAESATGGMVAARLTAVAGVSAVYRGSVVAYDNEIKRSLLGVPADLMAQCGSVSEPVARAMAEGVAELIGADVAVAITGSAGPDPNDQPVGTMVVAVRTPGGTTASTLHVPGDRKRVRTYTTTAALHHVRLALGR